MSCGGGGLHVEPRARRRGGTHTPLEQPADRPVGWSFGRSVGRSIGRSVGRLVVRSFVRSSVFSPRTYTLHGTTRSRGGSRLRADEIVLGPICSRNVSRNSSRNGGFSGAPGNFLAQLPTSKELQRIFDLRSSTRPNGRTSHSSSYRALFDILLSLHTRRTFLLIF